MTANGPLLIAYDGSPAARSAIDTTAQLHPGATAVVLYARQPLESLAAHLQGHPALEDLRGTDQASLDASERLAADGAALARKAGLTAEPQVISALATAAEAIVDAADTLQARVIILGAQGRRGVRAAVLGSTSTTVLHHAGRPVLVVPADDHDGR